MPNEIDELLQVLSVINTSPHVHDAPPAINLETETREPQRQDADTRVLQMQDAETRVPPRQDVIIDPMWLSTLEDMGFIRAQIIEAVGMLGGQPDQLDDLLQVLSVMNADASACDTSQNPSDCSGESSRDGVEDLAAAVVASAVSKAAVSLGWQQKETVKARADLRPLSPMAGPCPAASPWQQEEYVMAKANLLGQMPPMDGPCPAAVGWQREEILMAKANFFGQIPPLAGPCPAALGWQQEEALMAKAMDDKPNHHSSPIVGGA